MTTSAAVLLVLSVVPGADADTDRVIGRIREHFSRIHSVHVVGVDRTVREGGLWAADPAESKAAYDPAGPTRQFDLWVDPPKRRWIYKDTYDPAQGQAPSAAGQYYDGRTYTMLDDVGRHGVRMEGGSLATLPQVGPLQAIGFCFQDTLQSSLGDLLTDPSRVTLERLEDREGQEEWLVQVKPIPDSLRPKEWSDAQRRMTVVRMWVSLGPEVLVRRWAIFVPSSGRPQDDAVFGRPVPVFQLKGYNLLHGYVSCDWAPARDELRGRSVPMPRRVYQGNGRSSTEAFLSEVVLNPQPGPDTFLPPLPSGYAITKAGSAGVAPVEVTGGPAGKAARVEQISQEARKLLADESGLRARPGFLETWGGLVGCALLVVSGVAVLFYMRRRAT